MTVSKKETLDISKEALVPAIEQYFDEAQFSIFGRPFEIPGSKDKALFFVLDLINDIARVQKERNTNERNRSRARTASVRD